VDIPIRIIKMDKTFAIFNEDGIVENSIVADEYIIAQSLLPNKRIVEVTEQTGPCYINGTFDSGIFWSQKPFDSWVRDFDTKTWKAPVPLPEEIAIGFYHEWNESTLSWDLLQIPILNEGSPE
jgi:hypothetical protein